MDEINKLKVEVYDLLAQKDYFINQIQQIDSLIKEKNNRISQLYLETAQQKDLSTP
jgi:hypothetical protein